MEKLLSQMFPPGKDATTYTRYQGVNGKNINLREYYEKGFITRAGLGIVFSRKKPPMGSIGCYLSHLKLWDHIRIKHKPSENIMILEDDIEFIPKNKKEFETLWNEITSRKWLPPQWQMIYFDHNNIAGKPINKHYAIPYNNASYGCNANLSCYMIKTEALKKMKEICMPIGKIPGILEIDVLLRNSFNLFNALFYIDHVAKQKKSLGSCRCNIDHNMKIPNINNI